MSNESQDRETTNGEPPTGDETIPSREEVIALLEDGMREAHEKVVSGRVYNAENEKVRQKWIRTLGYVAGQYRQLKKDEDIEELEERISELEETENSVDGYKV